MDYKYIDGYKKFNKKNSVFKAIAVLVVMSIAIPLIIALVVYLRGS